VYLLAQAFLGINVSPLHSPAVRLDRPLLPNGVDHVDINGLTVGDCTLDLRVKPGSDGPTVDITRQTGTIEVAVNR
jgi:hypothetical protein